MKINEYYFFNKKMKNYSTRKFNPAIRLAVKFNNKNYHLSSHRVFQTEMIDGNNNKVMFHKELKEGQKWNIVQEYKGLYSISYETNDYSMQGWYLYYDLNKQVILSKNKKSLWKIEELHNKQFYIKDALYGYYLCLARDESRDFYSFYGTSKKEIDESNKNVFIFTIV